MSERLKLLPSIRRRSKSLGQKKVAETIYAGNSKAKRLMAVDFDHGHIARRPDNNGFFQKVVYTLVVRICEARFYKADLIRDSMFATLDVDGNHSRTRSVPKSENPLWVEQFTVGVRSAETSVVRFAAWYEHNLKDCIIARCDIPIDTIKCNTAIEKWYDLFPASSSGYVSGQVHVKIDSIHAAQRQGLTLSVVEGRNLPLRTLAPSEIYVKVTFNKQTFKTKSIRTSDRTGGRLDDPLLMAIGEAEWNEEFELKLPPESEVVTEELVFLLQLYKTTITAASEIGQFSINYKKVAGQFYDEWVDLGLGSGGSESAKAPAKSQASKGRVGIVRLFTHLNRSIIHSLEYYKVLLDYLLEGEEAAMSVVRVLESVVVNSDNRAGLALNLIQIYESKNRASVILKAMLMNEIENSSEVETLFRSNSLASRAVDSYMKIVGHVYLQHCVQDTVDAIYKKGGRLMLEPEKGKLDRDDSKCWNKLVRYMDALLSRIYASADRCPNGLRDIFHYIQQQTEKKFGDPKVRYTSVSGFLFLRFIVAAILGPKLFNLETDYPSSKVLSNLTVMSRVLQKIANFTPFDFSRKGSSLEREVYIENQRELMKVFLDEISRPSSSDSVFNPVSVDLQENLAYVQQLCEQSIDKLCSLVRNRMHPVNPCAIKLARVLDEMAAMNPNPRQMVVVRDEESGEWVPNPNFHTKVSYRYIGNGGNPLSDSAGNTDWSTTADEDSLNVSELADNDRTDNSPMTSNFLKDWTCTSDSELSTARIPSSPPDREARIPYNTALLDGGGGIGAVRDASYADTLLVASSPSPSTVPFHKSPIRDP